MTNFSQKTLNKKVVNIFFKKTTLKILCLKYKVIFKNIFDFKEYLYEKITFSLTFSNKFQKKIKKISKKSFIYFL